MKINVLYEDSQILVVNKPAGVVVMPGPGHQEYQATLAGWVQGYVGKSILGVGLPNRWGLVHRLDKDTSGVMVTAKTVKAFEDLTYQFRNRLVKKEYLALVWGKIQKGDRFSVSKKVGAVGLRVYWSEADSFEVKAPIGRNPRNPLKFAVVANGKASVTKFKWLKNLKKNACAGSPDQPIPANFSNFASLKAYPTTGRTHQIRVHLTAIGHAIVGDSLYSGRKRWRISKNLLKMPRHFLHAQKLEFFHPALLEKVSYEVAPPGDLQKTLGLLS